MEKLKIGIIGAGYIGFHRAQKYLEIPEVEVIGIRDPDPRIKAKARKLGVPFSSDPGEDFPGADAVSVAVPTPSHFEVARGFLERGKHVLLEKPIASSLSQAEELCRLARQKGAVFQIGHTERWNPVVEQMIRQVQDPRFFGIDRLSPYHERGTEVDVVMDLMIHDLDIVLELVSSPVKQVISIGVPVLSGQVDIANARVEFENGAVANLTASRVSLKRMRKIRVFQVDGYLSIDCDRQEGVFCRRVQGDGAGTEPRIEAEALGVKKGDALFSETRDFVAAIREKRPPRVGGEEGKRALALAEKVIHGFKDSIAALEGLNNHPDLFSWVSRQEQARHPKF